MHRDPYTLTLTVLHDAGARFLIVGGVAAMLHGLNRLTADIDLVIDLAESEARKVVEALLAAGFVSRLPVDPCDFAIAGIRNQWVNTKGLRVLSFHHPDHPGFAVDLFADPPMSFDRLLASAESRSMAGLDVLVCGLDDLIAMKEATGRQQDQSDVQRLRAIRTQRSNRNP
ncbi:MAG: nucleotidyl transferase AbiEii/AbiGii toxin family protein [Phycisphaerae bacterium]|nr:nucleotidyl transferase AbiEii/AbiGii toxin family protein [Phycisphaerae bacterium]